MKIRVLYLGSVRDRNGAAKVVSFFKDYAKSLKTESGHDIYVTDSDIYERGEHFHDAKGRLSIIKSGILSILGEKIRKKYELSYWGIKRHVERTYWKRSERLVENYVSMRYEDNAFIFHDLFTCWAYIRHCINNKEHIGIFSIVLHSNGELFKMLLMKYPVLEGTAYQREMRKRAEQCLKFAKAIVFVSDTSAATFQKNYPEHSHKVRIVRNGISHDVKYPNPVFDGKLRIITVGTVCKRKNQIALIKVLKIVRDFGIDATLIIVGNGPALNSCVKFATEIGAEKWIDFLGPRDDVPELLSHSNLFVMSSLDEGLPIAAIEALRAKLPLILTDVGGCKELILGNGYLVKPEMAEIFNAIISFSKDVTKQQEMSNASYSLFRDKYTIENMTHGYAGIAKEMLG